MKEIKKVKSGYKIGRALCEVASLIFVLSEFLTPQAAHAYVDPAAGNLTVQYIIACCAIASVLLKAAATKFFHR